MSTLTHLENSRKIYSVDSVQAAPPPPSLVDTCPRPTRLRNSEGFRPFVKIPIYLNLEEVYIRLQFNICGNSGWLQNFCWNFSRLFQLTIGCVKGGPAESASCLHFLYLLLLCLSKQTAENHRRCGQVSTWTIQMWQLKASFKRKLTPKPSKTGRNCSAQQHPRAASAQPGGSAGRSLQPLQKIAF